MKIRNSAALFTLLLLLSTLFTLPSLAQKSDTFSHTVREGDTFYGIARKYKISISDLRHTNAHIRFDQIRIGELISIPYEQVDNVNETIVKRTSSNASFVENARLILPKWNANINESIYKDTPVYDVVWDKLVGQSGRSKADYEYMATDAVATYDGGFLLSVYRNPYLAYKSTEKCLVKVDANGDKMWEKNLGRGYAKSLTQTIDGGIVIAGGESIIKTNQSGEEIWTHEFVNNDLSYIIETANADLVVVGDKTVTRLNNKAVYKWSQDFGSGRYAHTVTETRDGHLVFVGRQEKSKMSERLWICKTDAYGDVRWERTFGNGKFDNANSVIETKDGGLVVAGFSMTGKDICDAFCSSNVALLKTNKEGTLLWQREYSNYYKVNDREKIKTHNSANDLVEMENGHIVVSTNSTFESSHCWLLVANEEGSLIWDQEYLGVSNSIVKTSNQDFVLTGWDNYGGASNIWLTKFAFKGQVKDAPLVSRSRSEVLPIPLPNNYSKPATYAAPESGASVASYRNKSKKNNNKNELASSKSKRKTRSKPKPPKAKAKAKPKKTSIADQVKKVGLKDATTALKTGKAWSATTTPEHCEEDVSINETESPPPFLEKNTDEIYYPPFAPLDLPTLHVLSVGTKSIDLTYTEKDARDFANAFKNQSNCLGTGNKLFAKVNILELTGKKADAKSIEAALEGLQYAYRQGLVKNQDVLVLFFSAHGFMRNGKFRVQASDYDFRSPNTTSLNYEDILYYLNGIHCKKVVFIDACHSGGGGGGDTELAYSPKASVNTINKAILELSKKDGLTTIASSSYEEQSYEDNVAQNGFFTKAILQAFKGKGDKNRDDVVDLQELIQHLKKTVPKMVREQTGQRQNPHIISDELKDMPIYVVR